MDFQKLMSLEPSSPPYYPTLGSKSESETDDEFSKLIDAATCTFRPIEPASSSTPPRPNTPINQLEETKEEGDLQEGKEEASPLSSLDIFNPSTPSP